MPAPQWLIEGMFEAKSLIMLAGPSYSFKSFLLLDWLLCMAAGRDWNKRKTVPCKVAYALGEGKSSLLKRIQAWINHNNLSDLELDNIRANFKATFDVPQLASKASTDNLLADMEKENFKPEVIAIDTFARSMVGADENEAKDTGLWIEQADRLRQIGFGVIFLHHTKKSTEFGVQYRGSTAIIGAMDTAMTLVRNGDLCTLSVTKQKDHDEGPDLRFRRVLVDTGGDDQSCVLVPAPILDERFAPAPDPADLIIAELRSNKTFESDRARARELASRTGMSEVAAQSRVARSVRREA